MTEAVIVADSSPLIALSIIDQLELLKTIYSRVLIPPEVWNEITIKGKGLPGASKVSKLEWLKIEEPQIELADHISIFIDRGESEAIALALKYNNCKVLLDDAKARRVAERYRLKPIGTLGLLRRAKIMKLLDNIRPFIDTLQQNGIYISPKLVHAILKDVGEDDRQ